MNPVVAGLPQRVLVVRDQQPVNPPPIQRKNGHQALHKDADPDDSEATSDLSVNYIPLGGPAFIPAQLSMKPGERQFWRIVNSAAVSILDLQLLYDGVPQPMKIVALDGVPIGSQNGSGKGKVITQTDLFIPPAGRAEIVVDGPSSEVKLAQLFAKHVFTGPGGDIDPSRPIFNIVTSEEGAPKKDYTMVPAVSAPPPEKRFPIWQGSKLQPPASSTSRKTTLTSISRLLVKSRSLTTWMRHQPLSPPREQPKTGSSKIVRLRVMNFICTRSISCS